MTNDADMPAPPSGAIVARNSRLIPAAALAFAFAFLNAPLPASAQPMTPAEAKEALRHAQSSRFESGSFRSQAIQTFTRSKRGDTETGTVTTTTWTKRAPGQKTFSRTERVSVVDGHPERTRTSLSLVNAEGRWEIHGKTAVLMPPALDTAKTLEALNETALQKPSKTGRIQSDIPVSPFATRLAALAEHVGIKGERFIREGKPMIRVTRTYDDEARRFIREIVDEQIDAMKKQLSFGKRMLVSTALAAKGGIGSMLPAREVILIDVTDGIVVSTETFGADEKRLSSRGPQRPGEKVDDIPAALFEVPPDAVIIQPKSLFEAMEVIAALKKEQG